jgi:uncharacterized protein involved in response to NO
LLTLLGVLVLVLHLTQQNWWFTPQLALQLALDVVLFLIVVLAGRVIPMFTNNAIPGAGATRGAWTERLALVTVLLLLIADLLRLPSAVIATIAFAGALSHGIRLGRWKPWRTARTPLVWILHAAYAWIVIHLALRGLSEIDLVSRSLATHAFTIGAIGGMTLGMMTRTARGHTGRPLHADRYEVASYLLVQGAAIVRVGGGIITPALYVASVQLSGLLWAAAYSIYAVRYWPVLTQPRVDGKPG